MLLPKYCELLCLCCVCQTASGTIAASFFWALGDSRFVYTAPSPPHASPSSQLDGLCWTDSLISAEQPTPACSGVAPGSDCTHQEAAAGTDEFPDLPQRMRSQGTRPVDAKEILKVLKEIPRNLTVGKSLTRSVREQIIKLCNDAREACETRGLELSPAPVHEHGLEDAALRQDELKEEVVKIVRKEVRAAVVEAVRTEISREDRPLSHSRVATLPPGGRLSGMGRPTGASPLPSSAPSKPALIVTCGGGEGAAAAAPQPSSFTSRPQENGWSFSSRVNGLTIRQCLLCGGKIASHVARHFARHHQGFTFRRTHPSYPEGYFMWVRELLPSCTTSQFNCPILL